MPGTGFRRAPFRGRSGNRGICPACETDLRSPFPPPPCEWARRAAERAGLPDAQLHSVDPLTPRQEFQRDLRSSRYGLNGRPDRIMQLPDDRLVPVDVKKGFASRGGHPYASHGAGACVLLIGRSALRMPRTVRRDRIRETSVNVEGDGEFWADNSAARHRIIAATSLAHDIPLLTRDSRLRRSKVSKLV